MIYVDLKPYHLQESQTFHTVNAREMNTMENPTLNREKWVCQGIHYISNFGSKTLLVGTR